MKREYLIGIIIGIIGLGVIGYFLYQGRKHETNNVNVNNSAKTASTNTTNSDVNREVNNNQQIVLNTATISQHNSLNDCWLVVGGYVYDVTSYLPSHPKGAGVVLPYCGRADATAAFQTKGGRGEDHSTMAYSELEAFKLGVLNQAIAQP